MREKARATIVIYWLTPAMAIARKRRTSLTLSVTESR
jgi:hypothetical protein